MREAVAHPEGKFSKRQKFIHNAVLAERNVTIFLPQRAM
jgi:hypothetical protein